MGGCRKGDTTFGETGRTGRDGHLGVHDPYNLYELCVRLIENNNGIILDKVFAVEVDLLVQFKVENEDSFRTDLVELCKGQVEIVEIERNPESVFPVS